MLYYLGAYQAEIRNPLRIKRFPCFPLSPPCLPAIEALRTPQARSLWPARTGAVPRSRDAIMCTPWAVAMLILLLFYTKSGILNA